MFGYHIHTAVAFFIFRRIETTARVFAEIARAKPAILFIIADGPRANRPGEAEQCAATRALVEQINWPCTVLHNYAEANMGLRSRLASGLNWVFEQVEEAIILEDDCLPHPTFFRFCEELLDHYRNNDLIMHIAGTNFLPEGMSIPASYYFSRYPHVWGWATWRRAWQHYDVHMTQWADPHQRRKTLKQFPDWRERRFWKKTWDRVCAGEIDTWDYQWTFACMQANGFAINPAKNLVTNIGFGPDATHTRGSTVGFNSDSKTMMFPLHHAERIEVNMKADNYVRDMFFRVPPLPYLLLGRLRRVFVDVVENRWRKCA